MRSERHRLGPGVPDDGCIRVGCEKRRGGSMTMIYGLKHHELEQVARDLKRLCGTGGTVKGTLVELQGDRRDVVLAHFTAQDRRVKRMGG
jgi:translation initiation factor 1